MNEIKFMRSQFRFIYGDVRRVHGARCGLGEDAGEAKPHAHFNGHRIMPSRYTTKSKFINSIVKVFYSGCHRLCHLLGRDVVH